MQDAFFSILLERRETTQVISCFRVFVAARHIAVSANMTERDPLQFPRCEAPVYSPSRCGRSATTYAMTATAAAHFAISTGSILSTVSAGVWWMRKYFDPSTSSDML